MKRSIAPLSRSVISKVCDFTTDCIFASRSHWVAWRADDNIWSLPRSSMLRISSAAFEASSTLCANASRRFAVERSKRRGANRIRMAVLNGCDHRADDDVDGADREILAVVAGMAGIGQERSGDGLHRQDISCGNAQQRVPAILAADKAKRIQASHRLAQSLPPATDGEKRVAFGIDDHRRAAPCIRLGPRQVRDYEAGRLASSRWGNGQQIALDLDSDAPFCRRVESDFQALVQPREIARRRPVCGPVDGRGVPGRVIFRRIRRAAWQ